MSKKTAQQIDGILNELTELEADQHRLYYKHEQKGRARMVFLLLKLNAIERNNTKELFSAY